MTRERGNPFPLLQQEVHHVFEEKQKSGTEHYTFSVCTAEPALVFYAFRGTNRSRLILQFYGLEWYQQKV